MNVVVSGGTGFIGRALCDRLLEDAHTVTLLTRHPGGARGARGSGLHVAYWDGKSLGPWTRHLGAADAVINLAGENLAAKRWTARQKAWIINSRVQPTRALIQAIEQAESKPAVMINASACGYYGHVERGEVTESHANGSGFLAYTCQLWEQEARTVEPLGVRLVLLRTGVVLEADGGALAKMVPAFKCFLGGPLGSGRQFIPWIHRDDVVEIISFALSNAAIGGPINVTAPHPVTMAEFAAALGNALHRPALARVPAIALRIALGEMADVVLTGQRAIPRKLIDAGFQFKYPQLNEALSAILRK